MSKLKLPFLSLGARGTIGDAITVQERHGTSFVREKPIPAYRRTLPQVYQRWDYQDYAYLWTLLNVVARQHYQTRASRYHITGFNLFMREHLKELPDLAGRWRLDEATGAVAYDSSKNENNGTIRGASPVAGVINGARYFDGLNDWIDFGTNPIFNLTTGIFSIELFINTTGALERDILLKTGGPFWWLLRLHASGTFRFYYRDNIGTFSIVSTHTINDGKDHYIMASIESAVGAHLYVDGNLSTSLVPIRTLNPITPYALMMLARGLLSGGYLKAHIDNLIIYNRALDENNAKRHSERRYP